MDENIDLPARRAELRALIDNSPNLETCDLLDPAVQRWLAQAYVAVEATCEITEAIQFQVCADGLDGLLRRSNAQIIKGMLNRALARIEARTPSEGAPSFIPHRDLWGAFKRISEIFDSASSDVFVVDPYMNDSVLQKYAERLRDGISVRLLTTDRIPRLSRTLIVAAESWNVTHSERPAEVRIIPYPQIHDRIIAVDKKVVWIVTQSLKDLAVNAPATVTRFEDELTPVKLAAYEDIWSRATAAVSSAQ